MTVCYEFPPRARYPEGYTLTSEVVVDIAAISALTGGHPGDDELGQEAGLVRCGNRVLGSRVTLRRGTPGDALWTLLLPSVHPGPLWTSFVVSLTFFLTGSLP
jgi:hypothetical protein